MVTMPSAPAVSPTYVLMFIKYFFAAPTVEMGQPNLSASEVLCANPHSWEDLTLGSCLTLSTNS